MAKRTGIKEKSMDARIHNPITPRLKTLKGAAEYLGLTIWAMRERVWCGAIPVVRFRNADGELGRKMYFDVQDLESLIQQNKETIQ